jgi:hypothetical protein
MADMRGLVRVDGRMFDDGPGNRIAVRHDLPGEPLEQVVAPIEIKIQISVRRGDNSRDAGNAVQNARKFLCDGPWRLAQRTRKLKGHGHGQIAECAVGRDFDRKRGNSGQAVVPARRGRDLFLHFLVNAQNHEFRGVVE